MKHITLSLLIPFCVCISTHIIGMDIDPLAPAIEEKKEAAQIILPKQCNSLILLLDPKQKEQVHRFSALSETLASALVEKIAPIITSINIVQNVCSWKLDPALQPNHFPAAAFADVTITDKDWHCYAHKQAGLMLLIPKNYYPALLLPTTDSNTYIQAEHHATSCDFDIKNLDIITDVSPNGIIEYIKQHKPRHTDIITHLESMFLKPDLITSHSPSWNIYLMGHSSSIGHQPFISLTPISKKEELKKLKAQLTRESANHDELEEKLEIAKLVDDASSDTIALKRSSRKIDNIEKKIKKIEKTPEETKSLSPREKEKTILNNVLSLQSQIAGLSYNEFMKLLSFFEHGISTSYLHYTSCFSGGFNQAVVNEILSHLNVSFMVSSQGINEQTVYAFNIQKAKEHMHFTRFFTLLKCFFCDPTTFVTSKTKLALQKDPISTILRTIVVLSYNTYPFIRIPAIGVFNAFTVDKNIKIITNAVARAHEHEGTILKFIHPDIESIIMYPRYIYAPLAIKENVFIISPASQKWAHSLEKIHIFEKIFYRDKLSSLIPHFAYFNGSYSPITFVIKNLQCFDYTNSGLNIGNRKPINIENMIITLQGHGAQSVPNIDINIIFSCNNNTYFYSQEIKELAKWPIKEKTDNPIFDIFKKKPVYRVTPAKLNEFATRILEANNIQKLPEHITSLAQIVEQLEHKIDKTVIPEKPGHLKRVLLEKKSRSQTTPLSQEELEEQRLWRAKKK